MITIATICQILQIINLLPWFFRYCEVCEHPFVFTPIYRDDMPTRLPFYVLLQQSIARLVNAFITFIRSVLVVIVWLIILPTLTLWTWRFYFWSGENIGFTSTLKQNTTTVHSDDNDNKHYYYLLSYDWK